MLSFFEVILRLILSVVLSGILGLERQIHKRPVGFRTNALVSLGSTLVTLTSINLIGQYPDLAFNPAFLFLAIIPGIGFMGSGVIVKTGESVAGLTTAATLWVTATLGIVIGLGYYKEAIVVAVLVLSILLLFKQIDGWVEKQ